MKTIITIMILLIPFVFSDSCDQCMPVQYCLDNCIDLPSGGSCSDGGNLGNYGSKEQLGLIIKGDPEFFYEHETFEEYIVDLYEVRMQKLEAELEIVRVQNMWFRFVVYRAYGFVPSTQEWGESI